MKYVSISLGIVVTILLVSFSINSTASASGIFDYKGYILLDVEKNGEAYYYYPEDGKRYYLGRPSDAFNVMRQLGLGATHEFIHETTVFPNHVLGRILLDIEANGEAYYIYPKDRKKYFLGRPSDAFNVMRSVGLEATSENILLIGLYGDVDNTSKQEYVDDEYGFRFSYPDSFPDYEISKEKSYYENIFSDKKNLYFPVISRESDSNSSLSLSGLTVSYKKFDKNNSVQHFGYEGMQWDVDYSKERQDIESASIGVHSGSIAGSLGYNEREYLIKDIGGKKARVYYDVFSPSRDNYKIAQIYIDATTLVELSVHYKCSDYLECPDSVETFSSPFTENEDINKMYQYFDDVLESLSFSVIERPEVADEPNDQGIVPTDNVSHEADQTEIKVDEIPSPPRLPV